MSVAEFHRGVELSSTPFTINPRFQSLFTPHTTDERAIIHESISRDGCREPVVVWRETGDLVDGYNRQEICLELNQPIPYVEVSFASETEVCDWMIRNQLGRRNLDPAQIAYYRGQLYLRAVAEREAAETAAEPSEAEREYSYAETESDAGAEYQPDGESEFQDSDGDSYSEDRSDTGNGASHSPLDIPRAQDHQRVSEVVGEVFHVHRTTIERDGLYARSIMRIADVAGTAARNALLSAGTKARRKDVVTIAGWEDDQIRQIGRLLVSGASKTLAEAMKVVAATTEAALVLPKTKSSRPAYGADRNGRPIGKRAYEARERDNQLQQAAKIITEQVNIIYKLCEEGEAPGLYVDVQRIKSDHFSLDAAVKNSKFYCLHKHCGGRGCHDCRQSGWITRKIYDGLTPKERD